MNARFPALFLLFSLSACASRGDFPSLSPRPFETRTVVAPAPPPEIAPSNAATASRIAASVAKAEAGQAAFDTALSSARKLVGVSSRQVGSESWIAAQMAVSRLERTREPVQSALAELDGEIKALLMGPPSTDRTALEEALARVGALDQAQQQAIAPLLSALSPR